MKNILVVMMFMAGALCFSGCSTVLNTTTQEVEISSTPPNAKIIIDGNKFGTSPQKVNIDRGSNHVIKFELDGYDVYEMQLTRKISTMFWLNGLNGFIPGMVIDMFTGSMYNLLPEKIEAGLTPVKVETPVKKK